VNEKALIDLTGPLERHQREKPVREDGPNQLVLPPIIPAEKMKSYVEGMEEALNAPGPAEDKQVYNFNRMSSDKLSWQKSSRVSCGLPWVNGERSLKRRNLSPPATRKSVIKDTHMSSS